VGDYRGTEHAAGPSLLRAIAERVAEPLVFRTALLARQCSKIETDPSLLLDGRLAITFTSAMPSSRNACAGPFGAVYDEWIERESVARVVGAVMWGIDTRPMFTSMRAELAAVPAGAVVLDVPCGGGVAFRALDPNQTVRYLAVDLDDAMLDRARRRAGINHLDQVEFVRADMRELPFDDATADLCLTYSGLHMIPDPDRALGELVRCMRAGGRLAGSTFLADGSLRQRAIFGLGYVTGHVAPSGTAADLERWLSAAGLSGIEITPRRGLVLFGGNKPA
jgi:SAM-dependent methyltransferase